MLCDIYNGTRSLVGVTWRCRPHCYDNHPVLGSLVTPPMTKPTAATVQEHAEGNREQRRERGGAGMGYNTRQSFVSKHNAVSGRLLLLPLLVLLT